MTFETTQDAYRVLVNEYLSPALRELGFKGSGGKYRMPSDTHLALLELQKSAFGDRNEMTFTANLFVVPRDSWQPTGKQINIYGLRPKSGTVRDGSEHARLGVLAAADNRDRWWPLKPNTDLAAVAASFLADLEHVGLPWMKAREQSSRY